jgi:enoyl-CoA hydratase
MADDILLVDVSDRIATVTLNRPERRNAMNRALYRGLPDALRALDADDRVDVLILTGADPAFCAGADLKELESGAGERTSGGEGRTPWHGPIPPIAKPIIGAVNGPAITGGLELALTCDLLVASERAVFADTHARVGIISGDGMTLRLAQAIGIRRAKEMSITGNFLRADEALAAGLVSHVVAHAELLPFCRKLAADVRSNDQRAVRQMLELYDTVTSTTMDEAWAIEERVSREWEGTGFVRSEIAERRTRVTDRGREQL